MASAPEPRDPGLPVANVCKVEFRGNLNGLGWVNVMHVFVGDVLVPLTTADCQRLADSMYEAFATHFLTVLSTSTVLTSCDVTDLTSDLGAFASHTESTAGSTAGNVTPASNAAVVSWIISRHYRGGRPRTYLCGVPAGVVTDGHTIIGSSLPGMKTSAEAFRTAVLAITPFTTTAPELVVVHRFHKHLVLSPPLVDAITGSTVHGRLGTQRRRLGKNRF